MSEQAAIYKITPTAVADLVDTPVSVLSAGQRQYYEEKRRAVITELRALDRLLGRPQTVPERERSR
jgi:hypothetical protein